MQNYASLVLEFYPDKFCLPLISLNIMTDVIGLFCCIFYCRERTLEPREEVKKNVKENNHGIQSLANKNTEKRVPLGLHKSIQGISTDSSCLAYCFNCRSIYDAINLATKFTYK